MVSDRGCPLSQQDSEPTDRRPWIPPHLPVALSSRDWRENKDPVLDAVLRAIGARTGATARN